MLDPERALKAKEWEQRALERENNLVRAVAWALGLWSITMLPITLGVAPVVLYPALLLVWIGGTLNSPFMIAVRMSRFIDRMIARGVRSSDVESRAWAVDVVCEMLKAPEFVLSAVREFSFEHRIFRTERPRDEETWFADIVVALRNTARRGPVSTEDVSALLKAVYCSGACEPACNIAETVLCTRGGRLVYWDDDIMEFLRSAVGIVGAIEGSAMRTELARRMAHGWVASTEDLAAAVLALCPEESSPA